MTYEEAKKIKDELVREYAGPVAHKDIEQEIDDDDDLEDDEDDIEVEGFCAGTHTDANGKTDTWTDKDIQQIADKYNDVSATAPAPVCLGHPVDNSPAYGWIKKAYASGGKLILKLGELNKDFVKALKDGAYKTRSLSLYEDGTIRHLGFLGGMQPAIKGLAPLHFADNKPSRIFSFNERTLVMDKEVQDLRAKVSWYEKIFNLFKVQVDKEFSEADTKIIPSPEAKPEEKKPEVKEEKKEFAEPAVLEGGQGGAAVKSAGSAMDETIKKEEGGVAAPDAKIEVSKEAQAQVKAEANEEAKENEELKAQVKALESRLASLEKLLTAKAEASDNKAFCEALVAEGRLRPADLEKEIENLNLRAQVDNTRSFAEGQPTSVEMYKAYLKGQAKVVEFGELLTIPNAPAKDALVGVPSIEKYIEDKMRLDPKISYVDALKCVGEEHPDEMRAYLQGCGK